jgi:hypothetical protein
MVYQIVRDQKISLMIIELHILDTNARKQQF